MEAPEPLSLPDPPVLSRMQLKWLQSMQLERPLRNARRDTSNGYIVAEILSRYPAKVGPPLFFFLFFPIHIVSFVSVLVGIC